MPSIPPNTLTFVSASLTRRSPAALSSIRTASSGRYRRACSSSSFTLELAVSATASIPQAEITSRDCRPMEPVEPKIVIRLLILKYPQNQNGKAHNNPGQKGGNHCVRVPLFLLCRGLIARGSSREYGNEDCQPKKPGQTGKFQVYPPYNAKYTKFARPKFSLPLFFSKREEIRRPESAPLKSTAWVRRRS